MLRSHLGVWGLLIALACVLGVIACGGGSTVEPATPSETTEPAAPTVAATAVPTTTPQPPTATPAPTALPDLTPAQVFSRISPSIAFIETPAGSGSGVLIDDGYIVTNSHVLWPYRGARVVFPDGSEFGDVPVVNTDPLADIAVLGPIDTTAAPLTLEDGENLIIGSELLLVGYPVEGEEFPQPTITKGILSRLRQWEQLRLTYFQTDAAITGGQSGGALANAKGEVIGISGLRFSDAGFGLVASASDIAPIVGRLIRGEDGTSLSDRRLPTQGSRRQLALEFRTLWDTRPFVVSEPAERIVTIELDGDTDGAIRVSDAVGNEVVYEDFGITGTESATFTLPPNTPYFVMFGVASGEGGRFQISSDVNLLPYQDVDDGRAIKVGETIAANMDFPNDVDYFTINLTMWETVEIVADSTNVDPIIFVDFPGSRNNQIIFADDSGGGLFGTNPKVIYRAPSAGVYHIAVFDATLGHSGGYFLSVREAPSGSEPVSIPPSPDLVESPFGTMMVYVSQDYDFSIQIPAEWIEVDLSRGATFQATNPEGASVFITE